MEQDKELDLNVEDLKVHILDSKYREYLKAYANSSLLEILLPIRKLIGNFHSNQYNLDGHTAFSVCLGNINNADICKFAQQYFQEAPSPFYSLTQNAIPPVPKKLKLAYQFPRVSELEILEATFNLLQKVGPEVANQWEIADLVKYLKHENKDIRWYACNCMAQFLQMSEAEKNILFTKQVPLDFHLKMITDKCLQTLSPSGPSRSFSSCDSKSLKYMCRIGGILLPLHFEVKKKKEPNKIEKLISLPSTQKNLESIALGISSNRPVLVEGLVGSGKTSLITYIAALTGRTAAPEIIKIQLSDQTDSKTLIGTYMCTANPGEFIWQAGSVTQAVTDGNWLLLEDIDFAPLDVVSMLIPLLESRLLPVPGHGNIKAHPNFQVFTTRRLLPAGCRLRIGSSNLIENLWTKITLDPLNPEELKLLICEKWTDLKPIAEKLVDVYMVLSSGQHGEDQKSGICNKCGTPNSTSIKTSGRFVTVRDLIKWCSRMVSQISEKDLNSRAFQEALDCFCCAIPEKEARYAFSLHIGSHLNINEAMVSYYAHNYKPEIHLKGSDFIIGNRGSICRLEKKNISLNKKENSTFSKTRLSSCTLERVAVAVMNEEPVLLVGETGTGKTSIVQYLAEQTNHHLCVINMNQQSDSSDLLGGFKPVEIRTVVAPLKNDFEILFSDTFSTKKNSTFLRHIMMTYSRQKWEQFFALIEHSKLKGIEKLSLMKKEYTRNNEGRESVRNVQSDIQRKRSFKEINSLLGKWKEFHLKLDSVKDQIKKVKSSLAFAYIEGSLVKAVQEGKWVLLDEINLATADTLECLSGLLESSTGSLMLHERGDNKPIKRHHNFRLFACMNPATDVGKKELPVGLRNRFTEFYVDEIQDTEDLKQIVYEYLKMHDSSVNLISNIVKLYKKIKESSEIVLTDATGHKPLFSLRTLCRALIVARKNPCNNFLRSLYEAFSLSFLTQLDKESYKKVKEMIQNTFKAIKITSIPCPIGDKNQYVKVEDFWISVGGKKPETPERYILTNTVRGNLKDLARIVSIGRFPVLLQGDTSVGKTSLITYLARLTGNECVRINNHQHTDLQEYIGSYAPDETGKLVFKEGVLVQAMRQGYWVILDELNLAPTDILEALNRLLDDNRELFIPEIETTVKAHCKFMLFATQNPPGLYGGRQVLSRAFRNRFVELHFDAIPPSELKIILMERCEIPSSLSEKMVNVMLDLQNRRSTSSIFQGKQSFVTLRDLFRWAERYRLSPKISGFYDWDQHMADEGYLVLTAKIRLEEEVSAIIKILKKHLKRVVIVEHLFTLCPETSQVTKPFLEEMGNIEGFEHIVWTSDMRRLYVLISKALSFCEPVLLVGETGCGKTTVCQMIASLKKQKLYTVNCHMHTEGADFLGGLRPVRDRTSLEDNRLFEWVDGPLIQSMKEGGMFLADEISLADDSVLERLNSVLEPERTLVLAEKAGESLDEFSNLETIVAHEQFRLVGTMNPGGDYGKKELSPALRNRLTEIWCPKVDITRSASDVKLIIKHNIAKSHLKCKIEDSMVSFLRCFTETELGKKITVSIRDILSWVFFINQALTSSSPVDMGKAYVHGACLVILDGLGSGSTASSIQNWKKIKEKALKCLCLQAQVMSQESVFPSDFIAPKNLTVRSDDDFFGIEPFLIPKRKLANCSTNLFAFEAPSTCLNLLRLLRGLQLSRPVLLEGSPGVGKTSLVIALAKASGNEIVRINLSEQTDVSDLFGADLPVEGSEGGRFAWTDGPLLQALKKGSWIVLDELNLASQSVLEGLNACFDHRGEIFIPELNKCFIIEHHLTKIFACQNPQFEGGARKGLPKSFLNRFTQVFVEPLSSFDLEFILQSIHSKIPYDIISKMVKFNEILVEDILEKRIWGKKGGPWELNLRDMVRWCDIMIENQAACSSFNPGEYVDFIYADRMRTFNDKEEVYRVYNTVFDTDHYPLYKKCGAFFLTDETLQAGRAVLQRKTTDLDIKFKETRDTDLYILHSQTPHLESLINCINMNWMALLVGPSGAGKSSLVWLLSKLSGQRLETMSVNSHMDVTELLGGFEQGDNKRQLLGLIDDIQNFLWQEIRISLLNESDHENVVVLLNYWKNLCEAKNARVARSTPEELNQFMKICQSVQILLDELEKSVSTTDKIQVLKNFEIICHDLQKRVKFAGTVSGGGTFEWVDSALVKAVCNGYWLLIDGVNLCSPSVLDRLNGLLEPGGTLVMNERGSVNSDVLTITPHPDFRLFLTMDPQHGEISRAMRNRGIEIFITGMWQNDMDIKSLFLSQDLQSQIIQTFLTRFHFQLCEKLSGPEKPNISCLIQAAGLIKKLLETGQSLYCAVDLSLKVAYTRNCNRAGQRLKVQKFIQASLKSFKKFLGNSDHKNLQLMNMLCLNSKTLQTSTVLGPPVQFAALVAVISVKQYKLPSLQFPNFLPNSLPQQISQGLALFFSFANLPLKHWASFSIFLEHFLNGKSKALITLGLQLSQECSVLFQLLDSITESELPSDPRFNYVRLKSKIESSDGKITSLANKALIGLWTKIFLKLDKVNRKKLRNEANTEMSVYELSLHISKGLIGEKKIYHSSLKYISSLIQLITDLMLALSEDAEINLSDQDYFSLRKGLEWNRRLRMLCNQSVTKKDFHIFFPKLVFHWKCLQDDLLEKIPTSWSYLIPKNLQQIINQLKQAFSAHCSPLHQLVPEIRNNLGYPLPFTNKISAQAFEKLCEIADLLVPRIGYGNDKEIDKVFFLASDKGSDVKKFIVNIAIDMSAPSDMEEILLQIEELENSVTHHLSLEYSEKFSVSHDVKLWPFVDYFASKQLMMTILNQQGTDIISCKDVLSKASSIPFMVFYNSDTSNSLPAVTLYLFNVSNCSNLHPSRWFNYELNNNRELKENYSSNWDGEQNFVLGQMGCNLTYHLLCGFSTSSSEIEVMSIGNHSEKEIQLRKIRKTLWENWFTLSEDSFQYENIFKRYIRLYVSNLIKSVSKTFKIEVKCEFSGIIDLSGFAQQLLSSHKDQFCLEGVSILENILQVKNALESNEVLQIAELGVYVGLLQSWLLSHMEPLDPAHERNIQLSYCNEELQETKNSLNFLKWLKILRYCQTSEALHPHSLHYEKFLSKLEMKKKTLSQKVAYRPDPSQYNDIVQSISHFFKTVFLPSKVAEIVKELKSSSKCVMTSLQQYEVTLRSCDIFIRKLLVSHPLYRDLITPLLHGVVVVCESLRALMFLARNRELSLAVAKCPAQENWKRFDNVLLSLLNFPQERSFIKPDLFLAKKIDDQETVSVLIKQKSEKLFHQNQFLSLQASFYDLLNNISCYKSFSKDNITFLKYLIEKVISWWRIQENEKKRKEKEEESLYVYKARNLALSETEEEEIHREYMELFPDYANEFGDLDQQFIEDDMEEEEVNNEAIDSSEDLKLTDEFLEEVIEIHKLIVFNFTETLWMEAEKRPLSKPVTPVTLRTFQIRNLLKTIGPFGKNSLDSSALGSLIISNYATSLLAQKTLKLSIVEKPFSYYNDPDIEEALKIKPLLEVLDKKSDELLEKWPSHPSLLMIKKVISRILNFSVTSPLIRLVIGLETVLEKAQEWEKNAHKGVSLMQELTPITEQVIEWRKMELKAWNSCLDMISYKVYNEATKFWPHLYESFLSVTPDNFSELTEALKKYMESSLVGDFKRRLEILKAFHCQLCVDLRFCTDVDKKKVLEVLVSITWNFYKFYLQFEKLVEERLRCEKKPIEKKVKEFIKIMRWNDLNFFSVRDSVIKSRRTLHRYMRNWEKAIRQPFSPLLQDRCDEEGNKGEWDKEKSILNPLPKPKEIKFVNHLLHPVKENSYFNRLQSLTNKSFDFLCKTVDEMAYVETTEAVEDFTEDVLINFENLVNSASKAENIAEKEERIKALKDIVNRKKKSLANLFKILQHKGVSYSKGNSQWKEDFIDRCLTVPPMDLKVALLKKEIAISKKCLFSCDDYFYKGLGRQVLLFKSLQQAHKDVSPDDLKRLKGIASHFLILIHKLRINIPNLCATYLDIDSIVNEVDKAVCGYVPVQNEFQEWWKKIFCIMATLCMSLEEEIEIFNTFPLSDDTVIELQPKSYSFSELEVREIRSNLKSILLELFDLITHSRKVNQSLDNESIIKLSSVENIEELHTIVVRLSKIEEKLSLCIRIFDKELDGTTTLSKQLVSWIAQSKNIIKDFLHWKSSLVPEDIISCTFSPKAESCLIKLLKSVEDIFKHHNKEGNNETFVPDADGKDAIVKFVYSLVFDCECLRVDDIKNILLEILLEISICRNTSLLIALKSLRPILDYYLALCKNILTSTAEGLRSLSKLHSSLLGIFQQIATKGFCRSQEVEEQDGPQEGATKFQDSGPGLAEGEGMKDVSEKFESEDQLESALQQGEKEEEGNKNVKEETGVEISHDFEGALQDVDKEIDDDDNKEDGEDEEEDFDKQMGETEKGADKLDEKLWEDKDDEEEDAENKENEDTEHGPGDSETTESQIVAKDDNTNEKNDEKEKKKKELEIMEEDRREPDEEEEEETYDDNFRDRYNNEQTDEQEKETMDLPEELNLDGNENDEADEEEDVDPDMNPEIEQKGLFPEEEREPKDKNKDCNEEEENSNDEENGDNKNNDSKEGQEGEEEEEEKKSDKGRQRVGEELNEEDKSENKDMDDPIFSDDIPATKEAQSSDMETIETGKDKTKKNSEKASADEPDDELKQEEQGEMGEQTEDVTGVGQSDSKTKEESHVGETSALTTEDDSKQKMEDQNRPRHQGDPNQTKSLGEIEKEIHHGLLTTKGKTYKEENDAKSKEEKENQENDQNPENKESALYEHIQKSDDKFDKQAVDAGTRDEAKLAPAPVEEETNNEDEPEGIVPDLMEVDEKEEEAVKEETRKRRSDNEGNEGSDVKRKRGEGDEEMKDYETAIEGENVKEMVVQRPIVNEIMTQLLEDEIAAAVFNEDLITRRENIIEAEDGDTVKGSQQWEDIDGKVTSLSLQLCEQLRLILEPTEAAKLRGDYRTGKRLNMKKVIPYIASQFRKDKIWLRRSQPSKRSYQVLLAVDDSESMNEVNAGNLARESIALVTKALTLLEVGEVGVISFGEKTKILHPFHKPFSDESGKKVFGNLSFSQSKSDFTQMLEDSVALLSGPGKSQNIDSETAQLLLIISDGQTHACKDEVKAAVKAARAARVFIVFLVIDTHDNTYSFYDHLVYKDGKCESIVEKFPFPFFIVVRDLDGLPDAISTALRQWFELVIAEIR